MGVESTNRADALGHCVCVGGGGVHVHTDTCVRAYTHISLLVHMSHPCVNL